MISTGEVLYFSFKNQIDYNVLFILMQVDKLGFRVELASLLLTLGCFEGAEEMYWSLLSLNSDNYR